MVDQAKRAEERLQRAVAESVDRAVTVNRDDLTMVLDELERLAFRRDKWTQKLAASRIGVPAEEYQRRINAGQKWCMAHKTWHPLAWFGSDRSCYDRLMPKCRKSIANALAQLPTEHASQNCACGLTAGFEPFVDPLCAPHCGCGAIRVDGRCVRPDRHGRPAGREG